MNNSNNNKWIQRATLMTTIRSNVKYNMNCTIKATSRPHIFTTLNIVECMHFISHWSTTKIIQIRCTHWHSHSHHIIIHNIQKMRFFQCKIDCVLLITAKFKNFIFRHLLLYWNYGLWMLILRPKKNHNVSGKFAMRSRFCLCECAFVLWEFDWFKNEFVPTTVYKTLLYIHDLYMYHNFDLKLSHIRFHFTLRLLFFFILRIEFIGNQNYVFILTE